MTWTDLSHPLDKHHALIASTFKLQHLSPQFYFEQNFDLLPDLEL